MIKYVGIWALKSSVGWGITFTHYLVLAALALAAKARQTMSGRILRLLLRMGGICWQLPGSNPQLTGKKEKAYRSGKDGVAILSLAPRELSWHVHK